MMELHKWEQAWAFVFAQELDVKPEMNDGAKYGMGVVAFKMFRCMLVCCRSGTLGSAVSVSIWECLKQKLLQPPGAFGIQQCNPNAFRCIYFCFK
jgi:hypothetical protein